MFDPTPLNTAAINHGKMYESIAAKEFSKHFQVKVTPCGLFVNPDFPFLAASPDGLVNENEIVEIKCPYNGRNSAILPGKHFPFLTINSDGQIHLKETHNYYYQIMGQLAISKKASCIFIVYTLQELYVEKIAFDSDFFFQNMLPLLTAFYKEHYCPFIASHL